MLKTKRTTIATTIITIRVVAIRTDFIFRPDLPVGAGGGGGGGGIADITDLAFMLVTVFLNVQSYAFCELI
jgi:hypothetical protein